MSHDKPATLNPIPVGTRIMCIQTTPDYPEHLGATGHVSDAYGRHPVLTRCGRLVEIWCYGVIYDRHPTPRSCWAELHGDIVRIAPPDDVIIETLQELEIA